MRRCSLCTRRHYALGFCQTHRKRLQRGIPLELPILQQNKGRGCKVHGCLRVHQARGFCFYHYKRRWVRRNLEKVRLQNREWKRRNAVKARWTRTKVSHMRRVVDGSRIPEEFKYEKRCTNCDKEVRFYPEIPNDHPDQATIDHIVPVSLGGTNRLENLQTLCRSCNIKKSNKERHA